MIPCWVAVGFPSHPGLPRRGRGLCLGGFQLLRGALLGLDSRGPVGGGNVLLGKNHGKSGKNEGFIQPAFYWAKCKIVVFIKKGKHWDWRWFKHRTTIQNDLCNQPSSVLNITREFFSPAVGFTMGAAPCCTMLHHPLSRLLSCELSVLPPNRGDSGRTPGDRTRKVGAEGSTPCIKNGDFPNWEIYNMYYLHINYTDIYRCINVRRNQPLLINPQANPHQIWLLGPGTYMSWSWCLLGPRKWGVHNWGTQNG